MSDTSSAEAHTLGWLDAYRLRWKRRRLLWRAFRSRHQLTTLQDRTDQIKPGDLIVVTTLRNEASRLSWYLKHYRELGIDHFLIVDNDSDDGSAEMLQSEPDVSIWQTRESYRAARFGLDWMTWLQMRYAHDHWVLMADADELLIYANHDTRDLRYLTEWLGNRGQSAFGAHLLDLYPKGPLSASENDPASDPTDALCWFDPGPYRAQRQSPMGNLWVQGGVRERMFFSEEPIRSPTLNKIPLVRWSRRYAYVNSCHSALPRRLNFFYDGPGGLAPSGVFLHTKFLPEIVAKSKTEKSRAEHFHHPGRFEDYYDKIIDDPDLWNGDSVRFTGWRDLKEHGLLSNGGW